MNELQSDLYLIIEQVKYRITEGEYSLAEVLSLLVVAQNKLGELND